ncbi:hypothetical protein CVT24_013341 [Panaeolus cyanescens]|uniref:Uncharacterized protein n=1 Tax=Panaeolus cyanescens TaxID=181874 RepID=A0A409YMD6_9AGAR|nr:hypothetical protein CVT24_013341 [Panaeolus cyanescens]
MSGLSVGVNGSALTSLELELYGTSSAALTSTSTSTSTSTALESQVQVYTLTLPALTTLKATLDNATFFILSSWDLPLLRNLSVIAADFGYAGRGFKAFFEVHGGKVRQLELGHSSGEVEEWWIVGGEHHHHQQQQQHDAHQPNGNHDHDHDTTTPFAIPLNTYCPNLLEFICSADAEWNWRSPDWIAPHVLMPRHEGLEMIGVRGLERRLEGDLGEAVGRRGGDVGVSAAALSAIVEGLDDDDEYTLDGGVVMDETSGAVSKRRGKKKMDLRTALRVRGLREDPYFMLLQQFGSLLRREAFPGLMKVRDMSPESDFVRREGKMGGLDGAVRSVAALQTTDSSSRPRVSPASRSTSSVMATTSKAPRKMTREEMVVEANGTIARAFWERVVERCEARGVVLEDWKGGEVKKDELGVGFGV